MYPELAFKEKRTSQLIASRLKSTGLAIRRLAGTGVLATLQGARPGRTLMVRADMDGLPLDEQTHRPYSSKVPGAMHACGHDGHVAIAVLLAERLANQRNRIKGTIKFLFQPAEETANGAERCIQDGAMDKPKVDAVFGLHLWNNARVGTVEVGGGPVFAGASEVQITIHGKGGHGAMPHHTVDAIAIAGQIIAALQNLVSRQVSPVEPAVLSLGTIHGGHAFNVIANEVKMTGTLRAFDEKLMKFMADRVASISDGIGTAMGARVEVKYSPLCPPVVNDPAIAQVVKDAAIEIVGSANVYAPRPVMLGDDAAFLLRKAPGCYFLVGSANPAKGLDKPHHSPEFDFDEEALPIALGIMEKSALKFLR